MWFHLHLKLNHLKVVIEAITWRLKISNCFDVMNKAWFIQTYILKDQQTIVLTFWLLWFMTWLIQSCDHKIVIWSVYLSLSQSSPQFAVSKFNSYLLS